MKVIERIADRLVREIVNIDDMEVGFMPGPGTTEPIFLVGRLQVKYLGKKKLYFVDRYHGI